MPFDTFHQATNGDLAILLDARNRISGAGSWIKRRFKDGERYCLIGALSSACGSRDFHMPNKTERRLALLLGRQLVRNISWWRRLACPSLRTYLMSFNDHPRTTQEDVLALYDRAILHLISVPECASV